MPIKKPVGLVSSRTVKPSISPVKPKTKAAPTSRVKPVAREITATATTAQLTPPYIQLMLKKVIIRKLKPAVSRCN